MKIETLIAILEVFKRKNYTTVKVSFRGLIIQQQVSGYDGIITTKSVRIL